MFIGGRVANGWEDAEVEDAGDHALSRWEGWSISWTSKGSKRPSSYRFSRLPSFAFLSWRWSRCFTMRRSCWAYMASVHANEPIISSWLITRTKYCSSTVCFGPIVPSRVHKIWYADVCWFDEDSTRSSVPELNASILSLACLKVPQDKNVIW